MIDLINKIFSYTKNPSYKSIRFRNLKEKNGIKKIFSTIESYSENSEIRYVGGCIRKIINNEVVEDIDLAVNLEPWECIKALNNKNIKFYETGIDHGTITAIIDQQKFEITSLRKDIDTYGRHAKVKFTKDWYEDASRRDFSINSIYSDIDGNFYDPFGGKHDLEVGKIQFIGDAEKRIQEDYLRILRYIRFFLSYSKQPHDEKIKKAIRKNINGITKVSSERLLDEFKKIIISNGFLKLFKDSFCLEIINLIFPQFMNIDIFKNPNTSVEKKIKEVDYILLISLLIINNTSNADYFLFKFNLSNLNKKRILFLKEFNDKKINKSYFSEKNLWKIFYHNGKQSLNDLLLFEIFKSKQVNKKLIDLLNYFQNKQAPVFPIKARNLIEKYNISEGKLLGTKLREIEEKWINNDFKVSEDEISQLINN